MGIQVIRVNENILHIHYDSGMELHRAFGRFQAFYDAPDDQFRSYFTREAFDAWVERYPLWSAPWVGCNVPDHAFLEVSKFEDLSEEELFVLTAIADQRMPETYYVTATNSGAALLRHELCHALWYCYPEYAKEATEVLEKLPGIENEFQHLKDMGYKDSSLMDEANAYSCDRYLGELFDRTCEKHGVSIDKVMDQIEETEGEFEEEEEEAEGEFEEEEEEEAEWAEGEEIEEFDFFRG